MQTQTLQKINRPTNQNFAHGRGRSHSHKPARDPILEIVCHAIEERRSRDPSWTNKKLATKAGISPQTISRWQNYELTRRPQFFTINAVMQALGYKLVFHQNH